MGRQKYRIPDRFRKQIEAELGTATDTEIARRWTEAIRKADPELPEGWTIDRHTIFFMRKQLGIPAFSKNRVYSPPAFKGKFEDAYPEAIQLFGHIPATEIAKKFGVSRSTVYEAAKRLNLDTTQVDFQAKAEELLAAAG